MRCSSLMRTWVLRHGQEPALPVQRGDRARRRRRQRLPTGGVWQVHPAAPLPHKQQPPVACACTMAVIAMRADLPRFIRPMVKIQTLCTGRFQDGRFRLLHCNDICRISLSKSHSVSWSHATSSNGSFPNTPFLTLRQRAGICTAAWSAPELQRLSQAGRRELSRTKRCSRPAQAAAAADTLRHPSGGTTAVRPSLYAPRQKPTAGLSSASRPTVNSHLDP